LDEWQEKAVKAALEEKKNLFITGEAGSGKSFALRYIRDRLMEDDVAVALTAHTWKAASHIGGTSLHYFAGQNVGKLEQSADAAEKFIHSRQDSQEILDRIRKTEVLILDEVSMLPLKMLDNLEELCRKIRNGTALFGGIRCIFAGDFLQIPPVGSRKLKEEERKKKLAFEANVWPMLFGEAEATFEGNTTVSKPYKGESMTLCGTHRQSGDPQFLKFLNRLRYGYIVEEDLDLLRNLSARDTPEPPPWTKLYVTNTQVHEENTRQLRNLDGEERIFEAIDWFLKPVDRAAMRSRLDERCPSIIKLKVGAPVRLTHVKNTPEIHRGMDGVVKDFEDDGNPVVKLLDCGTEIPLKPEKFKIESNPGPVELASRKQLPLEVAFAVTLHKAQGMSLNRTAACLRNCFEPNMAYVALSRVRSQQGLKLLDQLNDATKFNSRKLRTWISNKLCRVDQTALEFHLGTLPESRREEIEEGKKKFEGMTKFPAWNALYEKHWTRPGSEPEEGDTAAASEQVKPAEVAPEAAAPAAAEESAQADSVAGEE
jgi:hypothetical protein